MGDYPYPSQYILNGQGTLPAWPVRAACRHLDFPFPSSDADADASSNATLLAGLREAVGVYYNYSGSLKCYDLNAGVNEESQVVEDHWSYQFWCVCRWRCRWRWLCASRRWRRPRPDVHHHKPTNIFLETIPHTHTHVTQNSTEMFMPSGSDGVDDMFWPAPWDAEAQTDECFARFGVRPRPTWVHTYYGGRKALAAASNIVFSNGLLDPWSGTGVLGDVSESVVALLLKEGAHHLDLMWSTPDDPEEVCAVRQAELNYIKQWVDEAQQKKQQQQEAAVVREA